MLNREYSRLSVQSRHPTGSLRSDSDIYSAALALISLPKSNVNAADDEDSGGVDDTSIAIVTPRSSFDSSTNTKGTSSPVKELHNIPLMPSQTFTLDLTKSTATSTKSAFYGSVPLCMPTDEDNISPLHCFVRKHGIEAFVATESEAQDKDFWFARNFKVKPGIVGMRCKYCAAKPLRLRGPKAVHYPSSIKCIYYSMENWQRHHAPHCNGPMPRWVMRELKRLMAQSKTGSGGRRRYWADSARMLGMVDTSDGIRFHSNPEINAQIGLEEKKAIVTLNKEKLSMKPEEPLLLPSDKEEISDYLFLLMSQMESSFFSEDDRTGSRSKIKDINLGYPGLQCKHCNGKAGVGRYFPVSLQNLTLANSDRNMYNHLKKCRRCPDSIKRKLEKLRVAVHKPGRKIKRGARKKFFANVWERLHGLKDIESLSSTPDNSADEIANHSSNSSLEATVDRCNRGFDSTGTNQNIYQDELPSSRPKAFFITSTLQDFSYSQDTKQVGSNTINSISRPSRHLETNLCDSPPLIQVNNYCNNTTHAVGPVPILPVHEGSYQSLDFYHRWPESPEGYRNDCNRYPADFKSRSFVSHYHSNGNFQAPPLYNHQPRAHIGNTGNTMGSDEHSMYNCNQSNNATTKFAEL